MRQGSTEQIPTAFGSIHDQKEKMTVDGSMQLQAASERGITRHERRVVDSKESG